MSGKVKACWGTPAAAPSLDEKAKVSAADTTTDYLNSKIVAGTGISKTILNPGANETLSIACTITDTDIKAKVSANDTTTDYLNSKIVAGTGITKTILNPGANETLEIKVTDTHHDKVRVCQSITPAELQLNGGASLQNATAGGGARFYYANLPEGSDGEVSFPINTKYDGTGFGLKIHWFVNDASHGTNHSMEYYAKMYRDSDAMAAETARAFTMVDAATDVNYIRVISPITVEGNFTSSGTNMHLTLLHRGDCGASGDLRILCLEITYLIELE